MPRRKRILFICGSLNQTTQMHQIARELAQREKLRRVRADNGVAAS